MILKRHGRRLLKSRRSRSLPPPLPLQLVFADVLEAEVVADSGQWETVSDDELIFREEPPSSYDAEQPFPLVTITGADDSDRAFDAEPSESGVASLLGGVQSRHWVQVAAVLAVVAMAVAAVWLPVRRQWLPAILGQSVAQAGAQPAASVVYVVPVTIVAQASGSQESAANELAAAPVDEEQIRVSEPR